MVIPFDIYVFILFTVNYKRIIRPHVYDVNIICVNFLRFFIRTILLFPSFSL